MSHGIKHLKQLTVNCTMTRWPQGENPSPAAGNMRAPDKLLCLHWVKKAWESVATEVIINSFKVCGRRTEDGLVHCIKPGGVAADAAAEISVETAALVAGSNEDLDDSDPFASDEELEDDETCIDDD